MAIYYTICVQSKLLWNVIKVQIYFKVTFEVMVVTAAKYHPTVAVHIHVCHSQIGPEHSFFP